MSWNKGKWTNGKQWIFGLWTYQWAADRFLLRIDKHYPNVNLRNLDFSVYNDTPNFGSFVLFRENQRCDLCLTKQATKLVEHKKFKHKIWVCSECKITDYKILLNDTPEYSTIEEQKNA